MRKENYFNIYKAVQQRCLIKYLFYNYLWIWEIWQLFTGDSPQQSRLYKEIMNLMANYIKLYDLRRREEKR